MDGVWCMNICQSAITAAAGFNPVQTQAVNPLASSGEEQDELGLQCLILLRNVLAHIPYIRSRVMVMPALGVRGVGNLSDVLHLSFVLDAVLDFHSLPFKLRSTTHVTTGRTKNSVLYLSLCYDILAVWACSLGERSLWTMPLPVADSETMMPCEVQFIASTTHEAAVIVPEFVWGDFLCVDVSRAADLMTSKFIVPISVACSTLLMVPSREVSVDMQWLKAASSARDTDVEMAR
jgi:hypothetical protein